MKPTPLTNRFIEDLCDKINVTIRGKEIFDSIIDFELFIEDSLMLFPKIQTEIHKAINPDNIDFYISYFRNKFAICWDLLKLFEDWTENSFNQHMQVIGGAVDDSQALRLKKRYQYCLDRSNEFFYYLIEYFEDLKLLVSEPPSEGKLKFYPYIDIIETKSREDLFQHWSFLIDGFKNGMEDLDQFINQNFKIGDRVTETKVFEPKKGSTINQAILLQKTYDFHLAFKPGRKSICAKLLLINFPALFSNRLPMNEENIRKLSKEIKDRPSRKK